MTRDWGLDQAIDAAGGVSALARGLGLSQPSISAWRRVPAERVLAVESLTGVARHVLRPDLYPVRPVGDMLGMAVGELPPLPEIDEVDAARATEYRLVGRLLLAPPNDTLLARLASVTGDETVLGQAHAGLAAAAAGTTAVAVEREFFNLFIGLGRGELLPYASYYLTGFLHERPLARVRADLARVGLARPDGRPEPEDHIGTLCEVMAELAVGHEGTPDESARFFDRHLAPWAARFFADLETAGAARFYRAVGRLGSRFIDIEQQAFALPA